MSVQAVNERLAALTAAGVSVWLDQIRRNLITQGELQRLVDEDCLRGVTSNPAIFEKAILGSTDYDDELVAMAREGLSAEDIYDRIAIKDVSLACDVLKPVWEANGNNDGHVSIEVGPRLARDTQATLDEARRYWKTIGRPNLMVKIPGTIEGGPAIEQAIYEGININVTLLFSVDAYAKVAEAYIRGLERRLDEGKSVDVRSVASFFVSRVDTETDKRLEALGNTDLQGTAAVANARAAYQHFKEVFDGERFARLREAGALVQRPLWASTGVKNPHYPETKYVDDLVAPHTVNTMPMQTLLAAGERSEVTGDTADRDPTVELKALADAGIDLDDVTHKLLEDGIELFVQAMDGLIAGVKEKRDAVVTGRPPTIHASIPDELQRPLVERVTKAAADNVAQRVWRKDESLWGGPGPEIGDRLGWLTISEPMLEQAGDLMEFARQCQAEGLTDAVLLGMGGSSLGPEVLRRSFGEIEGGLRLHVLDSTDATQIRKVESAIELDKTLFVVSSKSGATLETLSQFKYFHGRLGEQVDREDVGRHFVAITDPHSPLVTIANNHAFRRVFENPPDIGGRYSVLSYFGLVPAALMGVAIDALLHRCQVAEQNCINFDTSGRNSGLWLGLMLGEMALQGRDKATFIVTEPISSLGLWIEQLIAESTGKEGKGILPVAGEPVGDPDSYGDDRVFAYLRDAEDPDEALDAKVKALADAGHPTVTMSVHGAVDLGRVFFFAEFAVAVAGWVLGLNPFDQPNVQEAKDNTTTLLEAYTKEGALPEVPDAGDEELKALLSGAQPPHYVAILSYSEISDEVDAAVAELRAAIRAAGRATTTFGYGPRYLHSTGQLHKGGPATGVFLELLHDGGEDVEIPGVSYTFTTLKHAQAVGDLQTLRAHGVPAERVRLEGDPARAVRELTEKIKGLL